MTNQKDLKVNNSFWAKLNKLMKLLSINLSPIITQPTGNAISTYKFDEAKNILRVSGKEFQFVKDSKVLSLLKLIIKKPRGLYYDEAFEKIDGSSVDFDTNTKDNYYQLCRGIQNKLNNKGILNFLVYDFNQVKISDDYKKL